MKSLLLIAVAGLIQSQVGFAQPREAPFQNCLFGESTYPVLSSNDEGESFRKARALQKNLDKKAVFLSEFQELSTQYQNLIIYVVNKTLGSKLNDRNGALAYLYAHPNDGARVIEFEASIPQPARYLYVGFYPGENEYGMIFERKPLGGKWPNLVKVADINDSDIYNCKVIY